MTLSANELKSLASDVARLSALLTRDREKLPASYLKDPGLRRAYQRYFLPANLAKIHLPLAELARHRKGLLERERLRVLDIGSGPGTAILGVMEFFFRRESGPALQFTAVDEVGENLREAERLFAEQRNRTGLRASLRTVRASIVRQGQSLSGEQFDIITLSNVLNELFHGDEDRIAKRCELLRELTDRHLAPDGSMIIIEPALRETSRELLQVGCGLLNEGFHIYAPCPARGLCETLENPRDWQHEEVPWDPPDVVKEIDKQTGLRKDALKFSYLVLRTDGFSLWDACGSDAWRVVSEPLRTKGKLEYHLCGRAGRFLVVRLDKDQSPANDHYGTLSRGSIVRFDGIETKGRRLKVGRDTTVEPLRHPDTSGAR
jgi:ribosomal protein RSM22 (predicted rRNA methylase)